MAGHSASSNLAYSSLARGMGERARHAYVCKCGDCAHDGEEESETERKREFGVCVVGPVFENLCCAGTRTNCM